jgi:hypothetical protein
MSTMRDHPTKPEMPAVRVSSLPHERSAVYRRRTDPLPRDPLAALVEEVVTRNDDPRREP